MGFEVIKLGRFEIERELKRHNLAFITYDRYGCCHDDMTEVATDLNELTQLSTDDLLFAWRPDIDTDFPYSILYENATAIRVYMHGNTYPHNIADSLRQRVHQVPSISSDIRIMQWIQNALTTRSVVFACFESRSTQLGRAFSKLAESKKSPKALDKTSFIFCTSDIIGKGARIVAFRCRDLSREGFDKLSDLDMSDSQVLTATHLAPPKFENDWPIELNVFVESFYDQTVDPSQGNPVKPTTGIEELNI